MKKQERELLKGLKGMKPEDFDEYLQKSGVLVSAHAGRIRNRCVVPKKVLGVAKDDEFFAEYATSGTFSLLKKEDENALLTIENSARNAVKRFSIGMDNKYIPINVYRKKLLLILLKKK